MSSCYSQAACGSTRTSTSGATTPARYPWIGERMDVLQRDYLPAELEPLLAASGFEGTVAVQAQQAAEETEWLLELADRARVHPRRRRLGGPLLAARRRGARALRARGRSSSGVRHIVHDEPDDDFLLRADFRAASAGCASTRSSTTCCCSRSTCRGRVRARGGVPRAALRARPHREAAHPRRASHAVAGGPAAARRLPERLLQALRNGDRSALERLATGASAPVPGRGARGIRCEPADDRLRLAGLHARRRLRAHDGRRGRLVGAALGGGAGGDPGPERGAPLRARPRAAGVAHERLDDGGRAPRRARRARRAATRGPSSRRARRSCACGASACAARTSTTSSTATAPASSPRGRSCSGTSSRPRSRRWPKA